MKVLYKAPRHDFEQREIDGSLAAMQALVEGHIEVVHLTGDILLVCNEEGWIRSMEPNIKVKFKMYTETIYGPIFLCRERGEEMVDIYGGSANLNDAMGMILQPTEPLNIRPPKASFEALFGAEAILRGAGFLPGGGRRA